MTGVGLMRDTGECDQPLNQRERQNGSRPRHRYHRCETMLTLSTKSKSVNVWHRCQNRSRSPKMIWQQSLKKKKKKFWTSNNKMLKSYFCSTPQAMNKKRKCLASKNMKHFMTSLSAEWRKKKNHIIFTRAFKMPVCHLLATRSCAGNINCKTVIRSSA